MIIVEHSAESLAPATVGREPPHLGSSSFTMISSPLELDAPDL
jgi:hypothetical protein